MKVVVTGGSGRLGKYVLPELEQHGHEVIICDVIPPASLGNLNPPSGNYKFLRVDVTNIGDLDYAFSGVDAVVHLAAISHPYIDPPDKVFSVNMHSLYNVLEAAVRCKVRRVAIASSEAAMGFGFRTRYYPPLYFPLDEEHPRFPQDCYSLSKALGEDLAQGFSRRSGLETICLRSCWVWCPDELATNGALYRGALGDPAPHAKGLWLYVDARDVATAFRKAVEAPRLPEHSVAFLAAPDSSSKVETLELVERFYPDIKQLDRRKLKGNASLLDSTRIEELLGWRPGHSWREWVE